MITEITLEGGKKETMVKVLSVYNGLSSWSKKVIKAALGVSDEWMEDNAKKVLEMVSYRPHEYKMIFTDLIKHDAKLSSMKDGDDKGYSGEGYMKQEEE